MPSLSPFSLHVHTLRLHGLQPDEEKMEHKTEWHGLCGWNQNSDTFPHMLPTLLFPCPAAAILSFSLGIDTRCTWQTAAQASACHLHTSFSPGFKAQPGARNPQLARTAPPVKQKWSWDQNSLLHLNMSRRSRAKGFLFLPTGWLQHPYVPYGNWTMTFISPEQSKLQHFTPKFPLWNLPYHPFPLAHCCRFPDQLLSGKTRKRLGHVEKVPLV